MGCSSCGKGNSSIKCCLCALSSNKMFPWGAHRKICWRCKKKQELLVIEREQANKRTERLLAGIGK